MPSPGDEPFPWIAVAVVAFFVLIFASAAAVGVWCFAH